MKDGFLKAAAFSPALRVADCTYNAQQILAANENPDLFPDLVVRVTGFTAYFCLLTPEFRKLVVDRILVA